MQIEIGQTVYFNHSEEYWDKPFAIKRHHTVPTRYVILQAKVIKEKVQELKVKLFGNNGFEKDGETIVINKNTLLCCQNFEETSELGVWKYPKTTTV